MNAANATAGVRVLCVDNDVQLLKGLQRTLGRHFEVHTESNPVAALERLRADAGFAVLISDMQMPGMLGTQLLKEARGLQPSTVRMLLTGHADLPTALSAVNDGFVFRLLVKPCAPLAMLTTVNEAVAQHRLLTADRERVDVMTAQLLQSDRLATLGTLACGVGHEINNLTAVLNGLVEAFEEAAQGGAPPFPDDVGQLKEVARHLRAHGRHLLDLGRPSAAKAERFELLEVVERTLGMLARAGKTKRVQVEVKVAGASPCVVGHRTQLEQVLMNLAINAVDAMEGRPAPALVVRLEEREGRACCALEDSGAGMTAEVQARVFDPFFTTKAPGRGTGLGMPVVRQIIEAHGGRMQVDSQLGRGTTVGFCLPLAGPAAEG